MHAFVFPILIPLHSAMPTNNDDQEALHWSSYEIFKALSGHPLEVEIVYVVETHEHGSVDTSAHYATSSGPKSRTLRRTLQDTDQQTIDLLDSSDTSLGPLRLLLKSSVTTAALPFGSCIRSIDVSIDHPIQSSIPVIVSLESFRVSANISFIGKTLFANGYQSWSTSYAGADELSNFEKPNSFYHKLTRLGLASDMNIFEYPGVQGKVHSSLVTVIRDKCFDPSLAASTAKDSPLDQQNTSSPRSSTEARPEELVLCGSLSEDVGFTYFSMDTTRDRFTIVQDCVGKKVSHQ